jgi:dUTP pyrophosphatase
MEIKVQRLNNEAIVPTKANLSDAGWDLYAAEDAIIDPSAREVISTGVAIAVPDGFVGLIWDRSSMAAKRGVHRFAGVIDSGYRGEIKVCLWNASDRYCVVNRGERIAQILFQQVPPFTLIEVFSLDDTDRGRGGFGSSGK